MSFLGDILAKSQGVRTFADFHYIANHIRICCLDMVYTARSGHVGAPLGLADIYSLLYFKFLNQNVQDPLWGERDYFIVSNGHTCAVRYAAMALAGYMPVDELKSFRQIGSKLQGHPSTHFFPILESSSGSLGQGTSVANGIAIALRLAGKDSNVYLSLSDGECQEGMTWEACMAASHYNSDNLIAFVDYNNIQIDGFVETIMDLGDLEDKFRSFGWDTKQIDGHNMEQIDQAFTWAQKRNKKPKVILCKTILGKNVDFMENNPNWHGVPPNDKEYHNAMKQLNKIRIILERK